MHRNNFSIFPTPQIKKCCHPSPSGVCLELPQYSHLEYAASSVGPSCYQAKTGNRIEKVQRRAARCRWVTNQHDSMSSVTAMLKELDWQPLELRRTHPRLCLLYCTKLQMVLWPRHTFLISFLTVMLRVHHDMRTHCNMLHTNAGQTILNIFYFPHTIVLWNALPQAVVSSPTLVSSI